MTTRQKQARFWMQIAMTIVWAAKQRTPIVVIDWDRSEKEQALLVARGASKTLKSKHLDGLAVDFAFLADLTDDGILNYSWDRYAPIGEYAESVGLVWGGRFGGKRGWDPGHLEFNDAIPGDV